MSNESIKSFERDLKPFIDKRNKCDGELTSARNRLKNFMEQRDKCQASLNNAVREASEGKADVEIANEAKRNLDSICLLIDELEKNTIPSKELELKRANNALVSNLQTLLAPLKDAYLRDMNSKIKSGLDVGVSYIEFVETTIKELGLQDVMPWFNREVLYSIRPDVGKGLPETMKELMGLKK